MSAPLLMLLASFQFAVMGVCVKLASTEYGAGEIVFYRGLVGVLSMALLVRWRGESLRTPVPGMHFWRSASGVVALCLWFYAIGGLPLATAMTLNYMSSVWMALFLIGGSMLVGGGAVDGRLVAAVLAGFAGVALVLRPSLDQQQLWHGLAGLLSGMLAALAYLQVTALGRAGEPESRVVFYFSIGGMAVGAVLMLLQGASGHSLRGAGLLAATGVLATSAQLMMTRAYATGRPLGNAALQYLGVVFSVAFGALLFDEALTALGAAGIVLIVAAGLATTLLRNRARLPTATPTET
jgi:S-adenosylmethionine uptake transporter